MAVRGVRGATTAANEAGAILRATRELLGEMVTRNGIDVGDIAAGYFTVTDDLDAAFPAQAARELGWNHTPLLDAREIPVPGSLPHCIRVMLLWNTERSPDQVVHVYRNGAVSLRPDLVEAGAAPGERKDSA
jgi:chorismate mutase